MADTDLHFTSRDAENVIISASAQKMMARFARSRPHRETGGILIGHYSEDRNSARIEAVSDEPPDSRSGRTWFVRGELGLAALLERAWLEGRHYVGEWHSHPESDPTPSGPDFTAIRKIARQRSLMCKRPILIIIGGRLATHPEFTATLGSSTKAVEMVITA